MTSNRELSEDCVALAFYGVACESADVGGFYTDLIAWFNSVECPPDKLSVHGVGFGGKPVGFSRTHGRLAKRGFADVSSFTVFAMLPDGAIPTVDWSAIAFLWITNKPCFVLSARASVTTLDDDRLKRLTMSCIQRLTPAYGIGYQSKHNQGPQFYATGTNYGAKTSFTSEEYDEGLSVQAWGDVGMTEEVYKQGLIRDVYPRNYLTEPQLVKRIAQQTLGEWIESHPSRGTLTKLDDRMMLWKLTDSQVNSAREELSSAGVIFDWKSYVGE